MESSTVSDSVFYDATPSLEVEDYEHLKSLLEEYNAILAYPGLEMTLVSANFTMLKSFKTKNMKVTNKTNL